MRMLHFLKLKQYFTYAFCCILTGIVVVVVFFPKANCDKNKSLQKYDDIETVELKDILSATPSDVMIIDLRSTEQFAIAHIPDSMNFCEPWSISDIESQKAKDKQIIIVNLKHNYSRSVDFFKLLKGLKWSNIAIYPGGIEEWLSCGLPVETISE